MIRIFYNYLGDIMKKGIKIVFLSVVLIYLILYFSYKNGYYRDINEERKILTEEKIKEYEEDLANGVDVTQKEYVVIAPSYDNNLTRVFLKLSKTIENGVDKTIKYVFKKLNKMVDE